MLETLSGHRIMAAVRFRGGATTTLMLPRPLNASQLPSTHKDVLQNIEGVLNDYTEAKVAHILNESGLRTGAGDAFDKVSVKWVRYSARIKSLKERLAGEGRLIRS